MGRPDASQKSAFRREAQRIKRSYYQDAGKLLSAIYRPSLILDIMVICWTHFRDEKEKSDKPKGISDEIWNKLSARIVSRGLFPDHVDPNLVRRYVDKILPADAEDGS